MTSDELRRSFLTFFEGKAHRTIPSSSLVPQGDPSLLLTNAGMVQFKPYFLGMLPPPHPRLASCQKCFRTTDIESVGDSRHLTFFEMLGNFSIGDYFKQEAVAWAWEFVTGWMKLDPQRLWATVYLDDDEAHHCWLKTGVPEDRIVRLGDKDNFWGPAGDSGPCGPCSEIHYDYGPKYGCGKPDCGPGCGCGRFVEVWNLVFTQYNQDRQGNRQALPRPNIDTGMGLERALAAVLDKPSVYDTDVFQPLLKQIAAISGKSHPGTEKDSLSMRIVAEHSRGVAFLLADGVLPSNEGRGYILRRILRRAALFGYRLGIRRPFLDEITDSVISGMGHIYPELAANRTSIQDTVRQEGERFQVTLEAGLEMLELSIEQANRQGAGRLPAEEVFRLHDTYGFPRELTAEICRERGLSVDMEGFEAAMERQRERARASQRFGGQPMAARSLAGEEATEFVGYDLTRCRARVVSIVVESQKVETARQGQQVALVLDRTPFYAEMGGQVGDSGELSSPHGKVTVFNTAPGHIHMGEVVEGSISVGDEVEAAIDEERRRDIARNHTATHLLQSALRQVLGAHVQQKGSLVDPERLRFDFAHPAAPGAPELRDVQRLVNDRLRRNLPVRTKQSSYREAIKSGAIALFEEKYGDTVRVVQVGDPAISSELCGGTHVGGTGEIGLFLVTAESSIGTGLRRIEAVTGRQAEALLEERNAALQAVADELSCSPGESAGKIHGLVEELDAGRKRCLELEQELARGIAERLLARTEMLDGVPLIAARVPPVAVPTLRYIADLLRDRLKTAVVVLGTVYEDKANFVAMVTPDLAAKGFHAGNIAREVARVAGGSGGGKATLAQAGSRDKSKLDVALSSVKDLLGKPS